LLFSFIRDNVINIVGLVGPLQCTLYQDGVQVFADGGILCNYPIHCYDGMLSITLYMINDTL